MNCSPTLTAKDFKQVHNGLCRLASAISAVEDVIHPDLLKDLLGAQSEITAGLQRAYEQDVAAFDTKYELFSRMREILNLTSIWSIYEIDYFLADHDFGDNVVQLAYHDHWGNNGPVFIEIHGKTWQDLWVAADKAIRASGDEHHVFIEAFRVNPECPEQLILSTGS